MLAAACQKPAAPSSTAPHRLLIPAHGIYAGAYIEAGDKEDDVTLEKIEEFEQLAATAFMTAILIKRQLSSGSQSAVEAYLEMIERP